MKKKLYIILGFILVVLFSNEKIQAQESKPGILPDTLQVSLLTCGPGTEVYELFGHTALRVKQQRPGGFDYVFNYGMFNFDAPGFIWRFTKGETDYCLGINDFPDFLLNYQFRESKVDEQVLNLTPIQSEPYSRLCWLMPCLRTGFTGIISCSIIVLPVLVIW